MSVEGIEGSATEAYPSLDQVESAAHEAPNRHVDMVICSKSRPKICTEFTQSQRLDESRVTVILSDGSHWNTQDKIPEDWKAGDDIRIKKDTDRDQFVLKNVKQKSSILASLSEKCDALSKFFL